MQMKYFEDLPLTSEVMKGITELGFTELFPIQAQAIVPLLEGKDVIGQAQTGTGKTAAFGIPMVERVDPTNKRVQGLVLAPTRELAIQVATRMKRFSKYTKLKILPVYGGESINKQIRALKKGVHIVVGTPGRLIDHLKRGTLKLSETRMVVLDEADRMLDMGFIDDIKFILSRVPEDRQLSLFSATMDKSVMDICQSYMNEPEEVLVSKDEIALEQLNQYYMVVNSRQKLDHLLRLLNQEDFKKAIIFCNTRRGCDWLANKLYRNRYSAKSMHAGFTQAQRERTTKGFRNGNFDFLVATDVAARGLDIQGITHIINFDVPMEAPVYFHRIGRTARNGGEGTAITLVGYGEIPDLNKIKNLTNTHIEELE
ncbi:MAG: DEAD/DEAH box helicase, partial [Candidatus Bathyarchaeota archaeon]|nr:DEAD/DEAH box helicase [Candidatus Bathyarchaeota archaeon]